MLTQCPNCTTIFRVSPEQLKARVGKVRCGQCNHVFNALETLSDDPVHVLAEAAPTPPPMEPALAVEAAQELLPIETGAIADTEIEQAETEVETPRAPVAPAAETDSQNEDYLADPFLHEPVPATRRWPWVLGSVVAVFGLLAQAAYYYRVELAVLRPELQPALQAACQQLHCDVPRPRSINTLSIDSSDLRPDPLQPGRLTLTAMLRSKAPYAQEWPSLELTLTDVADHNLAIKNFPASAYLPKEKDSNKRIAAGFPAKGEVAVTLPLDIGDLPAVGYRLYVFYP